jgi:predicted thioesterase
MAKKVPLGVRGEAEETVQHKHTLNHHHDKLPPIYSTPNMIGLMEWAAANALLPFLDEGEISVGTAINIDNGKAEIGRGTVTRAIVNPAKVAERHSQRHKK